MSHQEDLKELLRRKGKTQSQVGTHQVYISQISSGRRRAGAQIITRLSQFLSCTTDEVYAACKESFRRANSTTENSASAMADDVVHTETVSGGAA
jgi:transcriptional regulator with XRE-family HTH domain